jgi:predicted nucleic acid-binding protein
VLAAYATIDAASSAGGLDMGKNDLWIAAIAHVYDLTLLTSDKDFDHLRAGNLNAGKLVDVEWVDPTSK